MYDLERLRKVMIDNEWMDESQIDAALKKVKAVYWDDRGMPHIEWKRFFNRYVQPTPPRLRHRSGAGMKEGPFKRAWKGKYLDKMSNHHYHLQNKGDIK